MINVDFGSVDQQVINSNYYDIFHLHTDSGAHISRYAHVSMPILTKAITLIPIPVVCMYS